MLLLKSFTSDRSVDSASAAETAGSYLSSNDNLYFHCASGFSTQILAYMLDSLVRVSRRVNENHFVRIANAASSVIQSSNTLLTQHNFVVHAHDYCRVRESITSGAHYRSSIQPMVALQHYNSSMQVAPHRTTVAIAFSHESN